ncbi:MAG: histidine--tRNA ligase [Acidobacteria bacterium]|nr:histidine--tRNA ligase [Acidobacteriota bacterium]
MIQRIRGTADILPGAIPRWRKIEETAREFFQRYGFREIRTPIFERTELFARTVGEETDIVAKEMYTFKDRSGESLSLRPESTASVVRAYIENKLWVDAPLTRLFYAGPQFRYERPQKGRLRQFHQIGAEVLGQSDDPMIEAEVIEMLSSFLDALGITTRVLLVNSIGCPDCRPRYLAGLRAALEPSIGAMCEDCRRRFEINTLRVLDCKVESDQAVIASLPAMVDYLCGACAEHFEAFRRHLDTAAIPYRLEKRLVRGLDYYRRTAFEIVSDDLGAQNTLVGGGRYDGLAELLGGPPTKGFGFALGVERMLLMLPEGAAEEASDGPEVYLAYIGPAARERAIALSRRLRRAGWSAALDFEERKLKKSLAMADKLKARRVLIIGDEEISAGAYILRDMKSGDQQTIEDADLVRRLEEISIHSGRRWS